MNAQLIWDKALIKMETLFSTVAYDMWIKTLTPVGIKEDIFYLNASTKQAYNTVNTAYLSKIESALMEENPTLKGVKVVFSCNEEGFTDDDALPIQLFAEDDPRVPTDIQKNAADVIVKKPTDINLNAKYTFDSFVVGKSNNFVYAAARAVAERPGTTYNPLFIYGGVGLGKTHLLHAIGNYLHSKDPTLKILYTTSEKFTNDYVASIYSGAEKNLTMEFRDKYRNVDVLMIDDIQFISGKSATQEEIFHTFNTLYHNNKQIIISSDRPPKEISPLEERLQSRFEWGLTADIQAPDIETRIAILQKKAQAERYQISPEILSFIAQQVDCNIREMEGLLNKIILLTTLTGNNVVTLEIAEEAAKDYLKKNTDMLTSDRIIDAVCSYFNVRKEDLVGKKKNKEIVEPRQFCIFIITELLDMPLTAIGEIFGGRDHTTIIYARDKIAELLKTNHKLNVALKDIRSMLLKK